MKKMSCKSLSSFLDTLSNCPLFNESRSSFLIEFISRLHFVGLLWCHDAYVAAAAIAIQFKPRHTISVLSAVDKRATPNRNAPNCIAPNRTARWKHAITQTTEFCDLKWQCCHCDTWKNKDILRFRIMWPKRSRNHVILCWKSEYGCSTVLLWTHSLLTSFNSEGHDQTFPCKVSLLTFYLQQPPLTLGNTVWLTCLHQT